MFLVEVDLICDMCLRMQSHVKERKNDCMSKEEYRRFVKENYGWKTVKVDGETYDICRNCAVHYGRDIKDELRRRNK